MPIGNAHTIHARENHVGWNPAKAPDRAVAPDDTVEFDCIGSSGEADHRGNGGRRVGFGRLDAVRSLDRSGGGRISL